MTKGERIGEVTHFFGKICVAVLNLSKDLKIGDCIKGHRNSGTSKLYHDECYDQLFIDLED